jgi:hypothetical protein
MFPRMWLGKLTNALCRLRPSAVPVPMELRMVCTVSLTSNGADSVPSPNPPLMDFCQVPAIGFEPEECRYL